MPRQIWSQESFLDLSIQVPPYSTSTVPFTENIHLNPILPPQNSQQQKNAEPPPETQAPYHRHPSSPNPSRDHCQCSAHFSDAYNLHPKPLVPSSLVLENTGNLARDHLSIERTWLSYMRTGLLIACTGVGEFS